MGHRLCTRIARTFFGAAIAAFAWGAASASADDFKVLHAFCSLDNCADGDAPYYNKLTMDSTGTLFGTTAYGGAHGWGTIFALKPNARNTGYKYKQLYDFCPAANCSDGAENYAGPILDAAGNLYGTASSGGAYQEGDVWELELASGKRTLHVIHSFCATSGCPDGENPKYASLTYQGAAGGAPYDGASPLYGIASYGGSHAQGVVYAVTPVSGTHKWKYRVLYAFCAQSGCADGATPTSLIADGAGHLFGTAYLGGANAQGVIFELAPAGKRWSSSVLYNFCSLSQCADGQGYVTSLTFDGQRNLLGAATYGGTEGDGVLFRLKPKGAQSEYSVLHSFCTGDCSDGGYPSGALALDDSGAIYGAASYSLNGDGNEYLNGVIYKFDSSGVHPLHTFCGNWCGEGYGPLNGVLRDGNGHLFGMTNEGGAHVSGPGGTVYELTPK